MAEITLREVYDLALDAKIRLVKIEGVLIKSKLLNGKGDLLAQMLEQETEGIMARRWLRRHLSPIKPIGLFFWLFVVGFTYAAGAKLFDLVQHVKWP